MKIHNILKIKGPQVFTIGEELKVEDAIRFLVSNNIGVLVVLSSESKIIGIISERDIIRASNESPDSYRFKLIKEIMTKKVIFAEPEDEIEYLETIMTQNKIRHVPIISKGVLIGIVSIGDIVKTLLNDTRVENKYLMNYISGSI